MNTERPYTWYIILELIVLFIFLPVLYLFDLIPFHKIIPLVLLFAYCATILIGNKAFSFQKFRIEADWKKILVRFLVAGLAILVLIRALSPYPVFADLNNNPNLLYMLIMYPVLSAFPQELIFREFFFYRYKDLFRHRYLLILINIVLFSFAHIYFSSWIVLGFTLIGGLIFSLTFFKTRSLLVVTIEHSLYGLLILTSGLSTHFYKAF